ncbi:MAG: YegS/Rv2252/BmrU family lipid kinase [Defluviitaleaceae bacterium]|nr:YegS/Rv2252/BmrU family lipid kinase [Defluviitaleaceae bacterium]
MKTLRLIYNPYSGDRRFKDVLDSCAEIFFNAGYLTAIIRVTTEKAMDVAIQSLSDEHALVVSGGDGTVNMAINKMKNYNKNTPLGIIPAGTANDFATFLEIPKDPRAAAEVIAEGKIISADLGCANGQYFNNVCGGGLFINVSHSIDNLTKSIFGKLAYYVKGLGQLPNVTPLKLNISTPSAIYEGEFSLFLVLNSGCCGGFNKISPIASINDGLLDLVAFRSMSIKDIAGILIKILAGEHLDDPRVLFLHESSIEINYLGKKKINTDVDGEPGPKMPLKITCEKGAINLIIPRHKNQ